jgi:hypothetical protein
MASTDPQNQTATNKAAKKNTPQDDYERRAKLRKEDPAQLAKDGEPVHFDCTIAKLVEMENADGDKEWVEVMSDTLYPGEKLKRVEDDNTAFNKDEKARREAATQRGITGDKK